MNNKNNKEITKKYEGKLLGIVDYDRNQRHYVEDFIDKKKLLKFLFGLYDYETTFTKSGFKFLEEYYGIDEVVKMMEEDEPGFSKGDRCTPKEYLYMKAQYAVGE